LNNTWKQIKNYPNYEVSDIGNVRSLNRITTQKNQYREFDASYKGKLLKVVYGSNGYGHVQLFNKDKKKCFSVHYLVLSTFTNSDYTETLNSIDHIDDDKTNNTLSNLEWCTQEYNIKKYHKAHPTKPDKQKIVSITKQDITKKLKIKDAAEHIGCSYYSVMNVATGYRKSIYGWAVDYV